MSLIRLVIAVICIAIGAIIGALNVQPVSIDLGFLAVPATLGIALIVSLLVGALLGGIAVGASLVLPLRRRLAAAEREPRVASAGEHGA